ncbi:MAG: hypothetical protein OEU26_15170 [Candidatus Tectomicrobia bacterium]|nr:hypothetical protein [Candidatus Tectomicrobia bacterium]
MSTTSACGVLTNRANRLRTSRDGNVTISRLLSIHHTDFAPTSATIPRVSYAVFRGPSVGLNRRHLTS